MRNTGTQYVNPEICAHRFMTKIFENGEVFYKCTVCNLDGPPVKIGWFQFLAESKAARKFYQLANKVDACAIVIGVILIVISACQLVVDDKPQPDDSKTADSSDSSDTPDTNHDTDTDTSALDTDTQDTGGQDSDTSTDPSKCPWDCLPKLGGASSPFSCSNPWNIEPTAVVNRRFECADNGLCCQPWPSPDNGIATICGGGYSCGTPCLSGAWVVDMVCFQADHRCCKDVTP